MSFEVKVTAQVGLHITGTKFYETLLFERTDSAEQVLIKHFGKKSQIKGGGQTKIDGGKQEFLSIWKSKGKTGEYTEAFPEVKDHGFYAAMTGSSIVSTRTHKQVLTENVYLSADTFMNAMMEHKIDNVTKGTILAKLGYRDAYSYDPDGDIIEESSEPEPSRAEDQNWGTW